ncbi:hypothetical protein ACFE04_017461 [Oxalis oulophora]
MSMRKSINSHHGRVFGDRKWKIPFFASMLVSFCLFLSAYSGLFTTSYDGDDQSTFDLIPVTKSEESIEYFVESESKKLLKTSEFSDSELPRLAYLISGTKGDRHRMMRTLQAVYHPRNQYILHLDLEAPPRERLELASVVKNDPMFQEVENVRVMAQSNLVTYKGPTMFACTLQAIAILLKERLKWDWFINLSASDYPLVTQDAVAFYVVGLDCGKCSYLLDSILEAIVIMGEVLCVSEFITFASSFLSSADLLYVFTNLSRNLNFIEHTQITGWKLNQRAKPIIIDPGLYLSKKSDLALTTQRRSLPTSFKLFTGSAWVMLTRPFVEYCIRGWENLPRTILMYYTNFISSPEGYFHTVICNNEEFRTTAISHDLHYIAWDSPPKQHPISLTMKDYDKMVKSKAPFARKFKKEDSVLDKIDQELLHRNANTSRFSPGAWCIGGEADPCSVRGNDSEFRPGPGAERLRELLQTLLSEDFRKKQCL